MTDFRMDATVSSTDGPRGQSGIARATKRVGTHNFSLLIALVILIAIFGTLRSDVFFSLRNILNIGQAIAILGILATAQTIVIISGGLDISVGAVVGLSTVCIALAVRWTDSPTISILFGVAIGAVAGLVNGLIVTVGQINAVIATLGTMAVFRGVAFIISNGQSISIFDPAFRYLGDGKLFGVPVTILILVVVVAIFFVMMRYTVIGRNIYAIGGNPVVARLAGLNVRGIPGRDLHVERRDSGPRGNAARRAHRVRAADFRFRGSRARGDHRGSARRMRIGRRQGNDRRRTARRFDHRRVGQRVDPHQRADLFPNGCKGCFAHYGCDYRRAAGAPLRIGACGFRCRFFRDVRSPGSAGRMS
jgi:hypothetical protein